MERVRVVHVLLLARVSGACRFRFRRARGRDFFISLSLVVELLTRDTPVFDQDYMLLRPILATVRYLPCSITGFFLNVRAPKSYPLSSLRLDADVDPSPPPPARLPARAAHRRHSRIARAGPGLDHDRRAWDRTRAALVCRAGLLGPVLAVAVPGHDLVRLWRRFHLVSRSFSDSSLSGREEKPFTHSQPLFFCSPPLSRSLAQRLWDLVRVYGCWIGASSSRWQHLQYVDA